MKVLVFASKLLWGTSIARWSFIALISLVLLSAHTKWKQNSTRKRMESSCADLKQTIFVALIGEHNTLATAQTIFSVFEQASCPKRIQIGLFELIDDADGDAVDTYKRIAEKNAASGISFDSQITAIQRYSEDDGPYGALLDLMDHGFKNQDYVLTLNDSMQMQKGWDKKLLDILARTPERTSLVITPSSYPSFTVLSDFEDGMPVIGLRSAFKATNVAGKFWKRECSFAPAAFWKHKAIRIPNLNSGTDALITTWAVSRGWKFLHPCKHAIAQTLETKTVSYWTSTRASRAASMSARKAFDAGALRLLGMENIIKIEPRMGIVNTQDEDEITAKYGSRADYEYFASKL